MSRATMVALSVWLVVGCTAPNAPSLPPGSIGSPSPLTTPSASSPRTPSAEVFELVEPFLGARERILDIAASGSGFVAVGYVRGETDCPNSEGRIWTSPDGWSWTRRDGDSFVGVELGLVTRANDGIYAFGGSGSDYCPPPPDRGNNVWRSTDEGLTWKQLTSGIGSPSDSWQSVAVVGETLVVTGVAAQTRPRSAARGAWTSSDGRSWQKAEQAPSALGRLAAAESTVVALAGVYQAGANASYSLDSGRTWASSTLTSDYDLFSLDASAANGNFIALANACCGTPGNSVGLTWTSANGVVWTPSEAPLVHRFAGERPLAIPGGVVAFTKGGETQLSTDGQRWFAGPDGPLLTESDRIDAAAATPDTVVLLVLDVQGGGTRIWRAPVSAFDPTRIANTVQPADQTVIGRAYRYTLSTHCGIRVAFDGGVWTAVGDLPQNLDNPVDHGTLTMLSQNEARYDSSHGSSLGLSRDPTPPQLTLCY